MELKAEVTYVRNTESQEEIEQDNMTMAYRCRMMAVYWHLCTLHCTLYTIHCTLYTVHCTLYTTGTVPRWCPYLKRTRTRPGTKARTAKYCKYAAVLQECA